MTDIEVIPESELQIDCDTDEEGRYIARVFHHPTSTIKISDYFWDKEDAVAQAKAELNLLVKERRQGGL